MRERSATSQYYVGNTYVEAPGLKPYRRMPSRRRDVSPPPVKKEYTLPDISKWGATFEAMEPLRRARDRKESLRRRMFGHHKHEVAENEDPESEARVLCVDSIIGDVSPELHSKTPLKALSEGMVELDLGGSLISPTAGHLSPLSTESVPESAPDNSLTAALRKMAAGSEPVSPVLPSPANMFGSRSLSMKDAQFAREVSCNSPAPLSEDGDITSDIVPLYKRRSNSVNPTPITLKYMSFKHERSKSIASVPCSSHSRNRSLTSIALSPLSPLSVPEVGADEPSSSEEMTVGCPYDEDGSHCGDSDCGSEDGGEKDTEDQWVPPNLTALGASGRSMGDLRGFAATGVVPSCLPRLPLVTDNDMMESGAEVKPVLRSRNRRNTHLMMLPVGPAANFASSLGSQMDEVDSGPTARTVKSAAPMAPPTVLFGYTADGHISVDQIKCVRVCLNGSMIGPIDMTTEATISSSTGSLRRVATGTQMILCGPLSGNDIATYSPIMTFMPLSSDLDPLTPIQRLACKSEEYKPLSIAKNQPPTGESGKGTRGAGVSEKAFKASCRRRLGENVIMTAEMTVKSTKNFRGGRGLQEIVDIKLSFESRWVYQGEVDDSIISNMEFVTTTNAFVTRGA